MRGFDRELATFKRERTSEHALALLVALERAGCPELDTDSWYGSELASDFTRALPGEMERLRGMACGAVDPGAWEVTILFSGERFTGDRVGDGWSIILDMLTGEEAPNGIALEKETISLDWARVLLENERNEGQYHIHPDSPIAPNRFGDSPRFWVVVGEVPQLDEYTAEVDSEVAAFLIAKRMATSKNFDWVETAKALLEQYIAISQR